MSSPPRGRGKPPPRNPRRRSGAAAARGSDKAADRNLGGEQVEGRHAVRELLAAGRRRVLEVWFADGMDDAPVLAEIADLAAAARVPVRVVGRARLDEDARTAAPQGVLARAEPLVEVDLDSLCRPAPDGTAPFLLCLDGVGDPHNLGALVRTAVCAGATGLVLPRHRSVHITPTVTKAAAGAIEYLPMAVVPGMASALIALARAQIWTVGLDAAATHSIFALTVTDSPIALVLGAEGDGLSRLVRQRCDVVAAVPQVGSVSSLNVAAAGAVACFEVARRRR